MAATCEIEFDNSPSKVVYCEQNLKGAVVLNLKEEIFVRGKTNIIHIQQQYRHKHIQITVV